MIVDLDERKTRDLYTIKLAGLPTYTYAKDLENLVTNIKGKHCFISRNKNDLLCNYAYIRFESKDDKEAALRIINLKYKDHKLFPTLVDDKTCYNCSNPKHILNKYNQKI